MMTATQPQVEVIPSTWTTSRVIQGTLVVILVAISFLLLIRFQNVAVIIFSGIVVSMAMSPSVDWLHRHKLPRSLSVIIMYLALLVLFLSFVLLLVPPIIDQLSSAIPQVEKYYQILKSTLEQSPLLALRQIALNLPNQLAVMLVAESQPTASATLTVVGQAIDITGAILNGLFTLTGILLIGFYWTLEGDIALRALLLSFSSEQRENAREILQEIKARVGGYVRGQGVMMLAIFVADFAIYSLIGVPEALAVALLAGLFEFVPVLGPTLGAIPAILVTFSYDPSKVVLVIVAGALVQFVENNLLAPRVMHKTVGINPIVTLLSLIAFGALFGFAGLLLAIPLAAIIQIIVDRSLLKTPPSDLEVPSGRDQLSKLQFDIQEYIADIRMLIRHKETGSAESELNPIEDLVEIIAVDLDQAIADRSRKQQGST